MTSGSESLPSVLCGGSCPACGFTGLMHAVEYAYGSPVHYDGVSEWRCPDCGTRVGRWTRRVLTGGMIEPPFGRGVAVDG